MNLLRLFIYFQTIDKPWGGGNQFLRAFKNFISESKKGEVELLTDIDDKYDVCLMNSWNRGPELYLDLKVIENLKKYGFSKFRKSIFKKKQRKKIVHRLDGLRASYINKFHFGDQLQLDAMEIADHIIFQSQHCLESFQNYGYEKSNYSIIHNGVNQNIFNTTDKVFWDGSSDLKVLSCSWSQNPLKGFSDIAHFSEIKGIKSYYVGRWPQEIDPKKVTILSPLPQEELSVYYKECDVFLHAAKNDPCPNVAFEALSSGLPLIYHNSGGTPEIGSHYGLPLPKKLTSKNTRDLVDRMKNNYEDYIKKIQTDMFQFSIERAGLEYIHTFRKVLE